MGRWLLIRRDTDDPDEDAYWLAYAPTGTTEEEVVRVCKSRWQIEECFAQAKGQVGMDHYEVRTWVAWHRFVTACAGPAPITSAATRVASGNRSGVAGIMVQ